MPGDRNLDPAAQSDNNAQSNPRETGVRSGPTDDFLVAGMLGGDSAALTELMRRYDRLVRYTIFGVAKSRCRADPEWLDSAASATWVGFVQSMKRTPERRPGSLKAYLARVAYNRAISALRSDAPDHETYSLSGEEAAVSIEAELEEPAEALSRLELLEALRACVAELGPDDRAVASQLEAITQRRWIEAAAALGLKESTLRSRWKRILSQLRGCVRKRTGSDFFAPPDAGGD
jgi:RNA polymerase sigma factor (sigma-70 family)